MAFGVLGSIIPQVSLQGPPQKEILFVGIQSSLTVGKVSICNHSNDPARVQLGYYFEGDTTPNYFEFNRTIRYGETYETKDLHVAEGQKLFVLSDQNKTSFIFNGKSTIDVANNVRSGILTGLISSDKFSKLLYQSPVDAKSEVTLSIVNLGTLSSKAKIGISSANAVSGFTTSCYLEYDIDLTVDDTYVRPNIQLGRGESIVCSSDFGSTLSFTIHGSLDQTTETDDVDIAGNVRINNSLGIGTTANTDYKLDVLGDSLFTGNLNLTNNLIVNDFTAINETGGFNIGITSNTTDVTPGNIKEINFIGVGNTFFYDSAAQRLDIKISGDGSITDDDALKNVAFLHYGGFGSDDSIRFPQKFHEIFSHEDAAVDIEDGINVDIDEDCLLVITDKNTFDTFSTEIEKTNFLSATGFRDNIRCVFDFDAVLNAEKKVGYVMIPDAYANEIDCDIEPGNTVSIGDMCVLIIGSKSLSKIPEEINNDLLNPYFLSGATY
ncbi:MAG: hypothetical protein CMO44_11780 [Verrucomicrobiales bacterium]|nr:hypothetical protein [Verrucomicrobiales bacterium]